MKQAVIDIGTNTCLLLIAESFVIGKMKKLADVHAIARLGEGVDKNKTIRPEAYERLKNILLDHKKVISEHTVHSVVAVATSAMRDAENRKEIIRHIKSDTGIDTHIISGDDESLWSYRGALCGLPETTLRDETGTLDIGGGSTELSTGNDGEYEKGKSADVGAVRITERFLRQKTKDSLHAARTAVKREIEVTFNNFPPVKKLIAVAGTPTALASIKLKLAQFDAKKVNGVIITVQELKEINEAISFLSAEEIASKYPAVHKSRADILAAGGLILEAMLSFLHLSEIQVSTQGLRYGIMIREFEKKMERKSTQWLLTNE